MCADFAAELRHRNCSRLHETSKNKMYCYYLLFMYRYIIIYKENALHLLIKFIDIF